jgi:hypothetical protein
LSIYKGVSTGASTDEKKGVQNEEQITTKPNSFTWTGKRKSDPVETNKPLLKLGVKAGSGITIKLVSCILPFF